MTQFKILYQSDGKPRSADASNSDFDVCTQEKDGRLSVTVRAKTDIRIRTFTQNFPFNPEKQDLYFLNGYQSWTDTKEFTPREREKNVRKLPKFLLDAYAFDRYGDATFYKYTGSVLHGYDVFYCKGEEEKFILNLNYAAAYLLIELDKRQKQLRLSYDFNNTRLAAGESLVIADYYRSDSVAAGMAFFRSTFPARNTPRIFGYTSWYNYYQNISEEILLRDLNALDGRFDLFQIDDGYETKVGDWLSIDRIKFPHGLQPVVDAAHEKGLQAGIWLAPFVAEADSQLFRTRKELFKRDKGGEFVKCGSNWSGFYALDLENEETKNYIRTCLTRFLDMGFDFFKLDFLYAVNLVTDEGTSRSACAEKAYAFLRECLGGKQILGCGATVFNCIGKFDYLRIGPDVSLIFDDVPYMRLMHRERISTKTTLQNTVYRSFFNDRLFGNDPDVFLLRSDNIRLSKAQRRALITLNALFGRVMMTSDNLQTYDGEQRKLLDEGLTLFRQAQVTGYSRIKNNIQIDYTLNESRYTIVYDTQRGILI